jgi:hypothetical protein
MKKSIHALFGILIIFIFVLLAGCMSALYPPGAGPEYMSIRFKPGSEPTGFKGIKWGTPLNEVQGMKFVSTDEDGVETYSKEGEELKIGPAKVEKIAYQFWKGRFFGVEISAKESKNCTALRDAVLDIFGSGQKLFRPNMSGFEEKYFYKGDNAVVFLAIEQRLEDVGMLILFDRKMKQEIMTERKEKIKKTF